MARSMLDPPPVYSRDNHMYALHDLNVARKYTQNNLDVARRYMQTDPDVARSHRNNNAVALATSVTTTRREAVSLESLPHPIMEQILRHLSVRDILNLGLVSRSLHAVAEVRYAYDSFEFVLQAEKDFPKHAPRLIQGREHPGNLACYICCRVREPAHFDVCQNVLAYVDHSGTVVEREVGPRIGCRPVSLRRYCIDCGLRYALHEPGDQLVTRMRQEYWVCACRELQKKPNSLKCKRCGMDCPLRPRKK